jgi:hypothetical protein
LTSLSPQAEFRVTFLSGLYARFGVFVNGEFRTIVDTVWIAGVSLDRGIVVKKL